jgi:hypothetical protein
MLRVPRWKIISGSRAFYELPGRIVEIGWARDVQKGDVQKTINVCVTKEADQADELPEEARRAIRTHGRTAVNAVLTDEDVPYIIEVTTGGLVYDYTDPNADDEEDDFEDDEDDFEDDEDEDLSDDDEDD